MPGSPRQICWLIDRTTLASSSYQLEKLLFSLQNPTTGVALLTMNTTTERDATPGAPFLWKQEIHVTLLVPLARVHSIVFQVSTLLETGVLFDVKVAGKRNRIKPDGRKSRIQHEQKCVIRSRVEVLYVLYCSHQYHFADSCQKNLTTDDIAVRTTDGSYQLVYVVVATVGLPAQTEQLELL